MKYTWMSWGITRENKNISSQKIGAWIRGIDQGMDQGYGSRSIIGMDQVMDRGYGSCVVPYLAF